jgi:hypothetical protein
MTEPIPPPTYCTGTSTRTSRFAASAALQPRAASTRMRRYGALRMLELRVGLSSPRAEATVEETGSWAVAPKPDPDDQASPEQCVFRPAPKQVAAPCGFTRFATARAGVPLVLGAGRSGKFELAPGHRNDFFICPDAPAEAMQSLPGLENTVRTNLRLAAVNALRRARSVTASGTTRTPAATNGVTGGGTLTYRITVKRIK